MTLHKRELGILFTILALMVVLGLRASGYFTHANLIDLFLENLPVMIIAIGMMLIILTGEIDISVGSVFAVCGIVAGVCAGSGIPVAVSGLIGCIVGSLCGALNGWLVAYIRIPSIVVTLATMVALRDGLRWKTQGAWVANLPAQFQWFGLSQPAFTTILFLSVILLIAAAALGLRSLRAGRSIIATGSNNEAARIAGINTNRVIFSVFTLTGFLTGIAAVFNSVRFNQIPSNSGLGLELKVIAAVAVGGAAITGGYATILGTVLGVILLGSIGSALTFLGISPYWEKAIQGSIILIAVAIDRLHLNRRKHADLLPN